MKIFRHKKALIDRTEHRGGLEAMSRGGKCRAKRENFFLPPPLEKILGGGGANYFSLIYGGNFRSGG